MVSAVKKKYHLEDQDNHGISSCPLGQMRYIIVNNPRSFSIATLNEQRRNSSSRHISVM